MFPRLFLFALISIGSCAETIEHTPPAVEPEAVLGFRLACGGLGNEITPGFLRMPYLQRVTSETADLMWTSEAIPDIRVEVTTPEGELVDSIIPTTEQQRDDVSAQQIAFLRDLEPDKTYCYSLVRGDEVLVEPTGFRTANDDPASTVRVLAFGDSGDGSAEQVTLVDAMRSPADLLITTGDIAYSSGTRREFDERFFAVYRALLRSVPAFPSSGNHEYRTEDAAPFREAFALPENGGAEGRERWYSFDWGPVHFVALDTELIGPVQAAWLEADLAAADRTWTIVYGHKPPHSSGSHGGTEEYVRWFVPALERHRVDLVLSGHDHNYERFDAIRGVTYITTGSGGGKQNPVGRSQHTAFSASTSHFLYVVADADSLTVQAIDHDAQTFDELRLERNPD